MIFAVATVFNEEDIIVRTLNHLWAEGVDRIYIADASTDSTRRLLQVLALTNGNRLKLWYDDAPYHYQPAWISRLAQEAYENGAEWVIPFDADEFWYGLDGRTIKDNLNGLPVDIRKVYVPMFQHLDWDHRFVNLHTLPKVCFRAEPGVRVANGNHDCSVPWMAATDVLGLRELHYRSFEHFQRKVRERNERLDPALPQTDGAHQRQFYNLSREQMLDAWAGLCNRETVLDPIPTRIDPPKGAVPPG